ncbi:MAG: NADH-quinone oxidoreductase subunit NuoH [Deltaproteobacteria bacterium]|nr:NADH-quinone oxidoreductase subunit NuoH [Deltaproteobacteria bacterium]
MEAFAVSLGVHIYLVKAIIMFIIAALSVTFMAVISGLTTWFERRIAGRMQSRIGPNRVGPQGLLQFVADAVKLFMKEDLIPKGADRLLFKMSPYLCMIGVFAPFVVLPWGMGIIAADLNVGVLYLISITALVVVGTLMAGWGSNNKWSLLGGMRSAAQIVSYEIPVAMGLLPSILFAGSLSMIGLMNAQGWAPWQWSAFQNPFTMIAFLIFFTGSLAEGNRVPFDLPEAESELVSGFNTEYSGFRFAVYFLAEWANLYVIGALTTAVFLGGGNLPEALQPYWYLSIFLFLLKTFFIMFVIIWLRWTLPRFRIDQLMDLSWKYLLPLSFIAFFGQAVYMLIDHQFPVIDMVTGPIMFLIFLLVLLKFFYRVAINFREQNKTVNTRA